MKQHVKIYTQYFGIGIDDRSNCEVCSYEGLWTTAVDIHHIQNKGIGGSKTKDYIANLIGLCRSHHNDAHNEKISKEKLILIHKQFTDGSKN